VSAASRPPISQQVYEEQLAAAILRYLLEHPQAMDTLRGITDWWLMRQQVRVEMHEVAHALRRLSQLGVLEEVGDGDDRRYRLRT
jgi:hypothetical protein